MEDDKAEECKFFLSLAKAEIDKSKFRWLVSAFLSAAYSYFDQIAFWASIAGTDPETGEDVADEALLLAVRDHVKVVQDAKYRSYVRTAGSNEVLRKLYDLRHQNTHRSSLSILTAGNVLPRDFHLDSEIGKGVSILKFCEEVMVEIGQLQFKSEACRAGAWPPPSPDNVPEDA